MKIKGLPDGKLFIQFKFNPSEHLLSTPDEIALLLDAVISIVDTEVRTIILDPKCSELSVTTKKKLREKKLKKIAFADIKQVRLVEQKKKNAIFLETADGEKELITFHKSPRKVNLPAASRGASLMFPPPWPTSPKWLRRLKWGRINPPKAGEGGGENLLRLPPPLNPLPPGEGNQ